MATPVQPQSQESNVNCNENKNEISHQILDLQLTLLVWRYLQIGLVWSIDTIGLNEKIIIVIPFLITLS